MTRRIRLQADFRTSPVWEDDADAFDEVEVEELPVSQELRDRLDAWAARYDATFNAEYPPDSGFDDGAAEQAFIADGAILRTQLELELGADWVVAYAPLAPAFD